MKLKHCIFSLFVFICSIQNISLAQWTKLNGPYGGLIRILYCNNGILYAGMEQNGAFISTDSGTSWTKIYPKATFFNFLVSNNNLFATAIDGNKFLFLHSTDNGKNWDEINLEYGRGLVKIDGYIFAGTGFGVYRSNDNGTTWTKVNSDTGATTLAISSKNLLTKTKNGIFVSTDNGTTWLNTKIKFDLNKYFPYYSFATNNNKVILSTGDSLFISLDNGINWSPINTDFIDRNITSLVFIDSTLFAGTKEDGVFSSKDYGVTWNTAGMTNSQAYSIVADGNKLYAGSLGGVFISTNFGKDWTVISNGLTFPDIHKLTVWGNELIAGTIMHGIYLSSDNITKWKSINSGLPGISISSIGIYGNYVFAGTGNRGLFRSSDSGENWYFANNGLEDTTYSYPIVGTTSIISKEDKIFAATTSGVYLSIDFGMNWTFYNSGIAIKSARDFAIIDSLLFVGTWGNGIFQSSINSINWHSVNNGLPNKYIADLTSFNGNLYAACNNGDVFLSTDYGASWTNIRWLFDTFTSLIVNDSILYAAGWDGVYIATNKGEHWSSINEGLTESSHIFSLVIINDYLYAGATDGIWKRPLSEIVVSVKCESNISPERYSLSQNYPNPFNPTTTIRYSIPTNVKGEMANVYLKVFDVLGKEVATLVNEEKPAGNYEVEFSSSSLPSGIYFYQFRSNSFSEIKKMILLK